MGDAGTQGATLVHARRRAAMSFLCVGAGIALAHAGLDAPSWAWLTGSLACAAAAAVPRAAATRIGLCLALVLLGGGWFTVRVLERPIGALDPPAGGAIVTLAGVATTSARELPPPDAPLARFRSESPRWVFDLDADALVSDAGDRAARGRVRVRAGGQERPAVRAGDRVRLTGVLRAIPPPRNPGDDDARLLASQRGVRATLTLTDGTLVEPDAGGRGWAGAVRSAWLRALDGARTRASDVVDRASGDSPRARFLLRGLLLGEYDPGEREARDAFARVGLAHALSISGFHLAVMAGLTLLFVRLTGERGRLEPLLVAGAVVGYACLVPASSPILRSAAMVLVLLLAESFGRRYDRLTILGWTAVALLAWRPMDLWSLGFQLSVGLTATLLWLGERFDASLWGDTLRGLSSPRELGVWAVVRAKVRLSVSAGVLCWLVSMPVLMHALGLVSPSAVPATVVLTPLIVLVLWGGYAALLVGAAAPGLAGWSSGVLARLCDLVVAGVEVLDALPGASVRVPPTSAAWAAGATLFVLAFARWGSVRRARWWVGLGAVLCWLGVEWTLADRLNPLGRSDVVLRIDMLDVGDGTSMLVRSGDDAMLWDVGGPVRSGLRSDLGRACTALGVSRVRTLAMTHPDADHYARAEQAPALGVRRVLVSARFASQAATPGSGASGALAALREGGAEVFVLHAGDTFAIGAARVTVLSPPADAPWTQDNDHSLVAVLEAPVRGGVRRVLLTGDIMDDAIARLRGVVPGPLDVLEVPHHGSAREASIEFVGALSPRVVLQSTGPLRANDPRWEAVRAGEGRVWLCTAERGWSRVDIHADGRLTWRTRRD